MRGSDEGLIPVWSKNSSSLAVSTKRKIYNADECIEGTGQSRQAAVSHEGVSICFNNYGL